MCVQLFVLLSSQQCAKGEFVNINCPSMIRILGKKYFVIHFLFLENDYLKENIEATYSTYCTHTISHQLSRTSHIVHKYSISMGIPDYLHFWAKVLGDKGKAGDQCTNGVRGSAHWQTRLLYPNPVNGSPGIISKRTMWTVSFLNCNKIPIITSKTLAWRCKMKGIRMYLTYSECFKRL